jgi:hypothetical protein
VPATIDALPSNLHQFAGRVGAGSLISADVTQGDHAMNPMFLAHEGGPLVHRSDRIGDDEGIQVGRSDPQLG